MTKRKEELQSSLKSHELRMEERNVDKTKVEIALQTRLNERGKKEKGKWPTSKGRGNFQNFDGREIQSSKNSTFQKGENNGN